jgi:hypothetical protein
LGNAKYEYHLAGNGNYCGKIQGQNDVNLQEYGPAITIALLGGVVFLAALVLIAIDRIKLRRKAKKASRDLSTQADYLF